MSANNVDPDQTPQYMVSYLGLHVCLCPFYGFPGKNGLRLSVLVCFYQFYFVVGRNTHLSYRNNVYFD